jgi:peptide/nickel transport system substrate-binding protein
MTLPPLLVAAALALACGSALAATLRVANQGDSNSMDPHSLNESLQLSSPATSTSRWSAATSKLGLAPALATKWSATSPTVWRFELRKGVHLP